MLSCSKNNPTPQQVVNNTTQTYGDATYRVLVTSPGDMTDLTILYSDSNRMLKGYAALKLVDIKSAPRIKYDTTFSGLTTSVYIGVSAKNINSKTLNVKIYKNSILDLDTNMKSNYTNFMLTYDN